MKKLVRFFVILVVAVVMTSCYCSRYAGGGYYPQYGYGYGGGGYNIYSPWISNPNGYGYGGYKPFGGGVIPVSPGNPCNWNQTGGGRTY